MVKVSSDLCIHKKTTNTRIIIIVPLLKMDSDIFETLNNNYKPLVSGIEVYMML